jgi:acyl carrier protein
MPFDSIEEIKPEVRKLVIRALNFENVSPEDILDDVSLFSGENNIKIDSIDALELVLAIQGQFKVKIDNNQTPAWSILNTVNNIAEFVYSQHHKD